LRQNTILCLAVSLITYIISRHTIQTIQALRVLRVLRYHPSIQTLQTLQVLDVYVMVIKYKGPRYSLGPCMKRVKL